MIQNRYTVNVIDKVTYTIGDKVWIKPTDAPDLEGEIIGFQAVAPFHPIVEFTWGDTVKSNAFSPSRINHRFKGKVK